MCIVAYLLVYNYVMLFFLWTYVPGRYNYLPHKHTHTQLDSEEDFPEDHTGDREEEFGEFEAHVPY